MWGYTRLNYQPLTLGRPWAALAGLAPDPASALSMVLTCRYRPKSRFPRESNPLDWLCRPAPGRSVREPCRAMRLASWRPSIRMAQVRIRQDLHLRAMALLLSYGCCAGGSCSSRATYSVFTTCSARRCVRRSRQCGSSARSRMLVAIRGSVGVWPVAGHRRPEAPWGWAGPRLISAIVDRFRPHTCGISSQ